jgi:Domain of unknown function (DUF4126)
MSLDLKLPEWLRAWLPDRLPEWLPDASRLPNLPDLSSLHGIPLDTPQLIAIAAALGWASGLRLYAVVFLTGLAGYLGWVGLPSGLHVLQSPVMLVASGLMLFVEFFADKIPGVDTVWDMVHTVVRIPAGAALAASVFGADQTSWAMAAALMGGTLAATSHVAKTTTRAAVNTSPEPFSNVAMSLVGDSVVPVSLWLSWEHPYAFFGALAVALVVMVALIWVFGRFLRRLARRVSGWFGAGQPQT